MGLRHFDSVRRQRIVPFLRGLVTRSWSLAVSNAVVPETSLAVLTLAPALPDSDARLRFGMRPPGDEHAEIMLHRMCKVVKEMSDLQTDRGSENKRGSYPSTPLRHVSRDTDIKDKEWFSLIICLVWYLAIM